MQRPNWCCCCYYAAAATAALMMLAAADAAAFFHLATGNYRSQHLLLAPSSHSSHWHICLRLVLRFVYS
jgi:hypothetical protein